MATVTPNPDGTLTVDLTAHEQLTYSGLEPGRLQATLTMMLEEWSKTVFQARFSQLAPTKQAEVMAIFTAPPKRP